MMNRNKHIRILIALLLILLTGAGAGNVWGQVKAVAHQEGAFYKDYLPNGMQKTNTHQTTVYIRPGSTKTLSIPTTGNSAPHSYTRWYDYANDTKNNNLGSFTPVGGNYPNGHYRYNAVTNTAIYTAPASFNKDVVAVDVAAYTDFSTSGNNITVEPTLSYRWIFNMANADIIANKINSLTNEKKYLEEKVVYIPRNRASSKAAPRVTLEYDQENYYVPTSLYPVNIKDNAKTDYSDVTTEGNYNYRDKYTFTLSMKSTGTSEFNDRFLYINTNNSQSEITVTLECKTAKVRQRKKTNSSNWSDQSGTSSTSTITYNIAHFQLKFIDESPQNYSSLNSTRSLKFLNDNFVLINKLDFDYDTNPATKENNAWLQPLQWDYCSYGFASALLQLKGERVMPDGCAPSQNEYGFVKTANVTGISQTNKVNYNVTITDPKTTKKVSGNYQYNWWNSGYEVRDRLYYETNGDRAGYFMYIDASDQPGVVAKLPLENKLCAGTKLFVSAGICSMTQTTATSYADLNFIFKGVDANGNEIELNRYTTGDIPLHTSSTSNPWLQAYYTFDFDSEVEYDRYLLQVENNATSTSGGDYAIDDIRVYRSKPAVQANQILLPCGNDESAKIKIRIGHEKLISMLGSSENAKEDIKINYQFMDEDKDGNKVAIEGYDYHKGASGSPFYDYGTIWIKSDRNEMTRWVEDPDDLDASFGRLPIADGTEKFAWLERVTNDPQGQEYYIVFRTPNNDVLKYNKEYYTTVANKNGDFETGICSLISDPFIIQKPGQITVDGEALVDGEGICYGSPITLGAILLDRINREPIKPCKFDWYFGDGYRDISGALGRYRKSDAYPSFKNDQTTELQPAKGSFTQDDYEKLKAAIDAHKLFLNLEVITRRILKGEIVLAKPIAGSTGKENDGTFHICTDVIQLDTNEDTAMPEISIGQGVASKAIRMSWEQINELSDDVAKTLWIPVNDFENSDKTQSYKLVQSDLDENLYEDGETGIVFLCGTTDPEYANLDFAGMELPKVARLNTISVGPGYGDQYLVFSFNRMNEIVMKEGYTYNLLFFFNEETNSSEIKYSICNGMCRIEINAVPKYLTWTGKKGDNWNNDRNWRRSTVGELYKDPANNDNFDETDENNLRSFVPMHNSMVTIANTTDAPAP